MADPLTLIGQLNIVVDDVQAAAAFYAALGFEVSDTVAEWAPHHRTVSSPGGLEVDLDSAAFARWWGDIDEPGVVVGVRLPSREAVDERYESLVAAGHDSCRAPYDAFWGVRYAVVRDPAGNAVGLLSPPDPERRTAPPDPATF